jgi:demethylmenaquinone methyltransferase/2-methoxy-6-polyprenyl-1,4-benzoquinol methylase
MAKTDFFNNLAEVWDSRSKPDMLRVETEVRLLHIQKGDRVLDVGTGTGVLIPLLTKFTEAENITAIDSAERMIELAKIKFSGQKINWITDDVVEHDFGACLFDQVICFSMFPHFEDKALAIKKLCGLLKPGGVFSIIHAVSKHEINGLHIHAEANPDINGDSLLPAAAYVPALQNNFMREEILIDNEFMFMVAARKRWQ